MLIGNYIVHHHVVFLVRNCRQALKRKANSNFITRVLREVSVVVTTPTPKAMPIGRKSYTRHNCHIHISIVKSS